MPEVGGGLSRREPGPSRGRSCSAREGRRGGGLVPTARIRSRFRHRLGQRGRGLGGPREPGEGLESQECADGRGGSAALQSVRDHPAGSSA